MPDAFIFLAQVSSLPTLSAAPTLVLKVAVFAAAAADLCGAAVKAYGLKTNTAGSCKDGGTLATAVRTALRGTGAEASAVVETMAASCKVGATLATAVPTTRRGAEAESSAVATATAGSITAVATLATVVGAAAASAAAWRLRRRELLAEGSRRGVLVTRVKNVLLIEPSILFASGTGSPEEW